MSPPHIRVLQILIILFSVEFPEEKVGVLQTNDHIHVEQDGEVKTQ